MPADLLFEIGCEEIPAKMLARQLADLPAAVEKRLAELRLEHKGVRALGTPRRLAIIVKQLADRQPDVNEEVVGPPVGAAFAADGSVTKAGQGFAAKNGVDPASLQKKEVAGKKGLYAVALRSVVGQETRGLLPTLLADFAKSIQWPKSQRWGWSETTFVRPLQWLVALYGGEVVPVAWANLTATRNSRGHRFLSNGPVEIKSPDAYVEALRAANVIVDPETRRKCVLGELSRLEKETGLRVRPDDALLDEVIHLGEYPVGVSGQFDPSYLEVPEEVIVTAMRTHQRYFAMERSDGKLANRFATMMATIVRDPAVVAHGNEKVIAARLADAKFFFAEDKKRSFEEWNKKLDAVVFQAKLGDKAKTIGDKVRRLKWLANDIAVHVGCNTENVILASGLCKADLASAAVSEFPELQGVMGRYYAKHHGFSDAVSNAIDEHWWPRGSNGTLPQSDEGACVALADRLDTLVGCFAVGLEPSGSADPYGLRRAAISTLSILLDRAKHPNWSLSLSDLISSAGDAFQKTLDVPNGTDLRLMAFFAARLKALLLEEGIPAVDVDAAISANADYPHDVRARARALRFVSSGARAVFKRIANIIDDAQAKNIELPKDGVDPTKFVSDAERNLYQAWQNATPALSDASEQGDFDALFKQLEALQPVVAAFFDKGGVMVMDPDPALRGNRLSLLYGIWLRFALVADLRKLAVIAEVNVQQQGDTVKARGRVQ